MANLNNKISDFPSRVSRGFTLIEVLIALLVFALGMLGLGLYSGNTLQVASTNAARAQSVKDVTQVMTSFYVSAAGGAAAFKAALDSFDDDNSDAYTYAQTLAGTSTVIQITAAEDSSGNNLFTTAEGSWVSPLSLGVSVIFEGGDDADTSNDKTTSTSYTFLLP